MYKIVLIALLAVTFCFPAFLQAQTKARPKSGEGVSAFLRRNNRPPSRYYKEFIRMNRKKLGKNQSLLLGVTYTLPPLKGSADSARKSRVGTVLTQPLFGPSYQKVKVVSNRLAGCCFYLVGGHGGPDPGAIGRVGGHELHEDEYAYDIILRLARILMEQGADVRIIIQDAKDGIRNVAYLDNSKRETCMGDPIPLNQLERLKQRSNKINALYAKDRKKYDYCRAIFIHIDSRGKRKQTDVFFYHSMRSSASKRLAQRMKDTFESKYEKHQPNRGFEGTVSGRNLYVLANTRPVSVFVEIGNIQNRFDQQRLIISSNRQALAKWLSEGFILDKRKSS